jgi:hypothetical protein
MLVTASEDATIRVWRPRGDACDNCDADSIAAVAKLRLEEGKQGEEAQP